ncbi:MAG: sigma-54 dependent transcriptional regulator [Acidobacteriota bacterium]
MSRLLLVEDDPDVAFAMERRLRQRGHDVVHAPSGRRALEYLEQQVFAAALLDLGLPDLDGLEVLESIAHLDGSCPVIVLTGRDDASSAIRALRLGATEYLTKPAPGELLDHALGRVLEQARQARRLESLRRADPSTAGSVGESPSFRRALDQLHAAAGADTTPVLLTGESGTGKEQAARSVHACSARRDAPFVIAHVAATPPDLLESELFGHEAGAFTGARAARRGLFELADGGVLFLDEIGELRLDVQAKLLRAIEGHPFRRVGGERELRSDFRLVTATHKDLAAEVAAGRFRQDLYYRIRVLEITLPPLRQRRGDVVRLARHFLGLLAADMRRPCPVLDADALARLEAYPWPGNVRELRNVIERSLVLLRHDPELPGPPRLGVTALPAEIRNGEPTTGPLRPSAPADAAPSTAAPLPLSWTDGTDGTTTIDESLESAITRHAAAVLERADGNVTHAARRLGISRARLRRILGRS